jgi:glutathione S-transferase
MADYTLNILRPSVNNLTARVFVRAAGLDFEEVDVWGKTMEPEYLAKYAAHLTPTLEDSALPSGTLGESCAIMSYLCNKHGLDHLYPTDPAERALVDNAILYHTGTLYPLLARATYPTLGFPQYAGEVGPSDASDDLKSQAVEDATAALADPLNAYEKFFLDGRTFIGGDKPSIADIRLAASLEFLRSIDYPFTPRIEEYMSAVESALGDAYSEPASDVRGFVESVKSPA